MSAVSYELRTGSYGPVCVARFQRKLRVRLNSQESILLDIMTGVAKLTATTSGIQQKNLFNRFFELTKAKRYSVDLARGDLILTDSIKKTKKRIPGYGLNIMLPTKGVLHVVAVMQIDSYNLKRWFEIEEEEARQQEASVAERPAEQSAEVPF